MKLHPTHDVRGGVCRRCGGETGWTLLASPCDSQTPEARAEYHREYRQRPEVRARDLAQQRARRAVMSEERKAARRERDRLYARERRRDPEVRARMNEATRQWRAARGVT